MEVNKSEDRSGTFDFQNTGEHTPVMYPRSQADLDGDGDVNPSAESDQSNDADQPAY